MRTVLIGDIGGQIEVLESLLHRPLHDAKRLRMRSNAPRHYTRLSGSHQSHQALRPGPAPQQSGGYKIWFGDADWDNQIRW